MHFLREKQGPKCKGWTELVIGLTCRGYGVLGLEEASDTWKVRRPESGTVLCRRWSADDKRPSYTMS